MSALPKKDPKTALVALARAGTPSHGSLVVDCIAAQHPTLTGRVRVRWQSAVDSQEAWLPTLRGLSIREGDRLLVSHPSNWEEAVVVGVIDGFARRPKPTKETAAQLTLRADEAVCVRSADGLPLFELTSTERGPEITFAQPDVEICVDGELRLSAKSISLTATEGEARIEACDDVIVRGENVHLN